MVEQPYRERAEGAEPAGPPPELVYVVFPRDLNRSFHVMWIRGWLGGIFLGAVLGVLVAPWAVWVVVVGIVPWFVWSWRRARRGQAIRLSVDQGGLSIAREETRLVEALPLARLRDVALDTTSIAPVMRETSISAVAVETRVRGEVDVARIVVVPAEPSEPVALVEEPLAHMDAVEGVAKIRTFLRKHGWVPEEERG
jgi:hypothetical protein